jgi:hypothetical protein
VKCSCDPKCPRYYAISHANFWRAASNVPPAILSAVSFSYVVLSQYMTFPAQSSEKMSLVPVLAMLLQFTPKELSSVQRAVLMEPAQGGLWSSLGLGGSTTPAPAAGPIPMPAFSSSRPAKEVKRPSVSFGSNSTHGSSSPAAATAGAGSPASKVHSMSSGALTTAALVGQQQQAAAPSSAAKAASGSAPSPARGGNRSAEKEQPQTGKTHFNLRGVPSPCVTLTPLWPYIYCVTCIRTDGPR